MKQIIDEKNLEEILRVCAGNEKEGLNDNNLKALAEASADKFHRVKEDYEKYCKEIGTDNNPPFGFMG